MTVISVSLPSDGTTADVADYNTPITTIVNDHNGNIDNTNIKTGAAIATAKLADDAGITAAKIGADAVTDAKLIYGKLRSRQGGSATNWSTSGTTTYDYSATDVYCQAGVIAVTSDNFVVTFPTAFNQVPIVLCSMRTATGANCYVICTAQTATTATFRVMGSDATVKTSETIAWMAIGQ